MLLIVEIGIGGEIFYAIHQYGNGSNKYTKDYDQNKEFLYLKYWDVQASSCCKSFQ